MLQDVLCDQETGSIQARICPLEEKSSFCHYLKIKLNACVKTEAQHQLAQGEILSRYYPQNDKLNYGLVSLFWPSSAGSSSVLLEIKSNPKVSTAFLHCLGLQQQGPLKPVLCFSTKRGSNFLHLLLPCTSCKKGSWYQFAAGDHPHILGKVRNFTLAYPARLRAPRGFLKITMIGQELQPVSITINCQGAWLAQVAATSSPGKDTPFQQNFSILISVAQTEFLKWGENI